MQSIFATHYHELVQLADELVAVRNYNVGVREVGETILFLHRLQPGGASRSYGIEVGRLAGLPEGVISRARAVLAQLEGEADRLVPALARGVQATSHGTPSTAQLPLFGVAEHPVLDELRAIDANALTPMAALQLLAALSDRARA